MTDQHPGFEAGDDSKTSPKAASNEALQQRVAAALYERERPPRDPHWPDAYAADREVFEPMAAAVLAALKPELDRLAEYENTINWMTTCTSCARVLDSSIRETERAERAEAALTHVRGACDQLRRAAVLADGQAHTDRERGILQAVDRITRALDEPAAGTTATQATDEPVPRKVLPPRDCLFGRDGARPCPTSDRCATCDPKEQPDA